MTLDNEPAGAGVDAIDAAVAIPETETTEDAQAEPVKPEPAAEDKPVDDKTFRNREARLQRRIGQLTAQKYQTATELEELRQKVSQLEKLQTSAAPPTGPKEEDYEGKPYGEYLRDVARHEAKEAAKQEAEQRFKENAQKAKEQSKLAESQQWTEQRVNHAAANADKAKATFPDYEQAYNEYADVLGSLPPEIERVLLEADNPSFAFYAMAKDGSIEQLASMTPTRAAAVIALAEQRGLSMKKPVTAAPAPLAPAKGTAPGKKSLDQMSADELKAWYTS